MTATMWPTTTTGWRAYFDRHRQLGVDEIGTVEFRDSRAARALVRSLRRFQSGEASGTRLADEARTGRHAFLDDDARVAIVAFMDEEHRHGELLARLLGELGSDTAARDLSTTAFVAIRRVFGFRAKLAVLLVAEIVAVSFYATVAEVVDEPTVRQVMASIHEDDSRLAFVTQLLRRIVDAHGTALTKGLTRIALLAWLRIVLTLALAGIAVDHHPLMRHVGFSTVLRQARRFERGIAEDLSPVVGRPLMVAAVG